MADRNCKVFAMNRCKRILSRFTKWLLGFEAGGRQSSGAVPLVLDDGSMSDHLRGPPIPTPMELLVGFAGIFRRSPKGPPPPAELDEYGLPCEWRRNDLVAAPFYRDLLARSEEHWRVFESWCESRSLESFPATPEIVLGFLFDPPVQGRALHDAWWSIQDRHEAYYWHDDACPWCKLTRNYGVDVGSDGDVQIPAEVLERFDLSFLEANGAPLARKSGPIHDLYYRHLVGISAGSWPKFEKWCEVHSRKALPATPETVLGFLLERPVKGTELYGVALAITQRHQAHYWGTDADPVHQLTSRYGVELRYNGSVKIPRSTRKRFDLSFLDAKRQG